MGLGGTCRAFQVVSINVNFFSHSSAFLEVSGWVFADLNAFSHRWSHTVKLTSRLFLRGSCRILRITVETFFPHFNWKNFSSSLQRMSVIVHDPQDESQDMTVYCKGAPEKIASLCRASSVPFNYSVRWRLYYFFLFSCLGFDGPWWLVLVEIQMCSSNLVAICCRCLLLLLEKARWLGAVVNSDKLEL